MDDLSIWEKIGGYGLGGILATLIFWFYQKREKEHKEFVTECLVEKKEHNEVLIEVVKENTAAMTKNTTVIEALHKRLDGEFQHYRNTERHDTSHH